MVFGRSRFIPIVLSVMVSSPSLAKSPDRTMLVCKNQGFMAIISALSEWKQDAIVMVDLSVDKKDRHDGLGKITQYDSNEEFRVELPVDSKLNFAASGPTTELRYSGRTKEGLILIVSEGPRGTGNYVKTTCSWEGPQPTKKK